MNIHSVVELIFAFMVPIGFIGVMSHRLYTKKSLTVRAIQYTAVVMIIPTIVVLAMENAFQDNVVGTLVGGLLGYLLSGLSNYDKQGPDNA
jgi:hypothetical protein